MRTPGLGRRPRGAGSSPPPAQLPGGPRAPTRAPPARPRRRPRHPGRAAHARLPRGTAADRRAARTSQGVSRRTFVARSRGWCLGRGSRAQKLGQDGARRPPRREAGAPGRPGGVQCRPRPAVWRFLSLIWNKWHWDKCEIISKRHCSFITESKISMSILAGPSQLGNYTFCYFLDFFFFLEKILKG